MTDKDAVPGEPAASPQVAEVQQSASDWPKPGQEGYVHPDGTPQSVQQLADNRRAAADRAAAGSTVHGAPMATPGPDPQGEAASAAKRAEDYSGPSVAQSKADLTQFVRDAEAEAADAAEKRQAADSGAPASRSPQRTADDSKPKSVR